MSSILYKNIVFVLLLLSCTVFILLSNPFLKIPYDMWQHLCQIGSIYQTGDCFVMYPGDGYTRNSWHYFWAMFFKLAKIKYDFYLWAKIIHTVQFLLTFFSILLACRVFLIFITKKQARSNMVWLASLFATIIYFPGAGTFSGLYQQAWIAWYSVNYQITLPLYFLASAMFIFGYMADEIKVKLFYLSLVVVLSLIISLFHAMELLYLVIFMTIFGLFHIKELLFFIKHHKTLSLILTISFLLSIMIAFFVEGGRIVSFIHDGNILSRLILQGVNIVHYTNRLDSSFSEPMFAGLLIGILFASLLLFGKKLKWSVCNQVDTKSFFFLLFLSLFFLAVPTTVPLASIFSITGSATVWRFFFAPPWFIFFALFFLILIEFKVGTVGFDDSRKNIEKIYPSALMSILFIVTVGLLSVISYNSKNIFLRNIFSIYNMSDKSLVRSYTDEQQYKICEELDKLGVGHGNLVYARSDIALMIRACGQYVFASRLNNVSRKEFYSQELDKKFILVDFPDLIQKSEDLKMSLFFSLDKKD